MKRAGDANACRDLLNALAAELSEGGGLPVSFEVTDAEEIAWAFPGSNSEFPWWGDTPVVNNLMNLLEHLQDDIAETTTEQWPALVGAVQDGLPKINVAETPVGFIIAFGEGPGRLQVDLPWDGPLPEGEGNNTGPPSRS